VRARIALSLALTSVHVSPASALAPADMGDRTAAIATEYLRAWSGDGRSAVADVPYVYGPTVLFYGHPYSRAGLMAEKRRAVERWPVRRYAIRPGTLRVTCNVPEAKCAARATMDYAVSNPAMGTSARGSARFDLGVGFAGPRPLILYEGGAAGSRGGR